MIELDQLWEGGYFRYRGDVIRIQDIHMKFLNDLKHHIVPIPLDVSGLFSLGFRPGDVTRGEYTRKNKTDREMWLRPRPNGVGWACGVGVAEATTVSFVHELQQIWFAIFREPLRRSGDEAKPLVPLVYHLPRAQTVAVTVVKPEKLQGFNRGGQAHTETIPYIEQPYYFTWDCRWLIRIISTIALWRVEAGLENVANPEFKYCGYTWGLTYVAGRDVSPDETKAAGRWLHKHLGENNIY